MYVGFRYGQARVYTRQKQARLVGVKEAQSHDLHHQLPHLCPASPLWIVRGRPTGGGGAFSVTIEKGFELTWAPEVIPMLMELKIFCLLT